MAREWSTRTYEEGDEYAIFELRKAVDPETQYDREKWLRWWRWMYKENPAGAGMMCLAEHGGRVVGQYAIVPLKARRRRVGTKGSSGATDQKSEAQR